MRYNFVLPSFSNRSSIFHYSSLVQVILKYVLKLYLFLYQLFLVTLFIVSFSFSNQALTGVTSAVIEGNAPYLTFDGGRYRQLARNIPF